MHWRRFRSFFPVTEDLVYLDHAGGGALSSRAQERLARFAHDATTLGAFEGQAVWQAERDRVRERAAALLGVRPAEIVFPTHARQGFAALLEALDWRPGDVLVLRDTAPQDVPGRAALVRRGVEVRTIAGPDRVAGGRPVSERAIVDAIASPSVRMLATRSVDLGTGERVDLDHLGALCRERAVMLAVDASASLGCLPLRPTQSGIDFVAADGHRWLGSLRGCGILYCAAALRDALRLEDAVEADSPGVVALGGAVDLLLEAGIDAIAARVLALRGALAHGLRRRGCTVLGPEDGNPSGAVLFRPPRETAEALHERLRLARIHVGRAGASLRASPHFYNTEAEIERLLEAVSCS